jgi:hypothetical protein
MAETKDVDARTTEIPRVAEDGHQTVEQDSDSPKQEKPSVISDEVLADTAANEIFKAGQVRDVRQNLALETSSGPMASGALEKMHLDNARELLAEVHSVVKKASVVPKTLRAIGTLLKRFVPGIE